MRILFFSTAFPQLHDPTRSPYNLHRCEALARRHDVYIISPVIWSNAFKTPDAQAGGPITQVPMATPTFYYPRGVWPGSHAWFLWQSVRRTAAEVIQAFRPEVVLSYWTYPDGAAAQRIAAMAGVPAVAMVGGSDVLAVDPERVDANGRRVTGVLTAAAAVVTVSDHLKARICELGLPADKVHVLPPAVDTKRFSPGDRMAARQALGLAAEERVLVWAGRLVGVKALDILLPALRDALANHPETRLYLIGSGPLKGELETQARQLGIADRVVFAGRASQEQLAAWYQAADLTVLPSHWEGTPNALLESHACGVPFVATAVGAIPQLAVPGVDELVTPGDATALAAALDRALARRRLPDGPLGGIGGWDDTAARLAELLDAARRRTS